MKELKFYEIMEGDLGGDSWLREVATSIREAEKDARAYRKNTDCEEIFVRKNVLKFENLADFSEAKELLNSIKNKCWPNSRIIENIIELADYYDPMFDCEVILSILVRGNYGR